jgi:replicative DNA helicase
MEGELERKLLHLYLFNRDFYLANRRYLKPETFSHPLFRRSVQLVDVFYRKYGDVFNPSLYFDYVRKDPRLKSYSDQINQLEQLFSRLQITEAEKQYITDNVISFFRQRVAEDVLVRGADLVKENRVEDFLKLVNKKLAEPAESIQRMNLGKDYNAALCHLIADEGDRIPSSIPALDKLMEGGFGSKRLYIVMGGPGSGKSIFLTNMAHSAMIHGRRVLYYSLELSTDIVMLRMMSIVTGLSKMELKKNPKLAQEKLEKHPMKSLFSFFEVIETYSMGAHQLTVDIDEYINVHGFTPDLIIVDYMDLMERDHRYDKEYIELEELCKRLRQIAMKHNCVVLTASQVNREGVTGGLAKNENVAGSYGKIKTADLVMSLNQTDEERQSGKIRIAVTKNREYITGRIVTVNMDYKSLRVIGDENEPIGWMTSRKRSRSGKAEEKIPEDMQWLTQSSAT